MKRCQICNTQFTDEYTYCLSDGTVLVSDSQAFHNAKTEIVPPAIITQPDTKKTRSWLYVLASCLVAAVIASVAYIYLTRPTEEVKLVSPTGTWNGDWKSDSAAYTATMNLTETNGNVTGRIIWTLLRNNNQPKTKSGLAATEYVEGIYDSATRMLKIHGVKKDDPNGLVILDNYNLSLSEDGSTMGGRSKNGVFNLRR